MLLPIILLVFVIFFVLNCLTEKNIKTYSFEGKALPHEKNSLVKLLNDISSGDKVILENIKEKWSLNKNTIDEELRLKVTQLIKEVLGSIKQITDYSFFINNIENLYVMKDDKGNFRCVLNCFIYEVRKYYTIKLVMDFVSFDGDVFFNFIDIDESSINNVIDKYDIRWKGAGILSDYDMFDENTTHILDNYYNSNYEIVYLNNKDINIDKTTLFTMEQLRNNYLPSNAPKDPNSPYFCKKNTNKWNYKGVKTQACKNCVAHDNSYEGLPNLPMEGPGIVTSNPDNNEHMWLFSPGMGSLKSSAQH